MALCVLTLRARCTALRENKTLLSLSVAYNALALARVDAAEEALCINKQLQDLDISHNPVASASAARILATLAPATVDKAAAAALKARGIATQTVKGAIVRPPNATLRSLRIAETQVGVISWPTARRGLCLTRSPPARVQADDAVAAAALEVLKAGPPAALATLELRGHRFSQAAADALRAFPACKLEHSIGA